MKIGGTLGFNEEKLVEHWDLAMKHGGRLGFNEEKLVEHWDKTHEKWWNIRI